MINKILPIFVILLFPAASAIAENSKEDIENLLAKMHHAAHMINYEGTFIYGQHNELSTMQIIHSVSQNGEFERLISLDGSGREVIRSGNTVTCILPDKNAVVVDKSRPDDEFPPSFPVSIDHLSKMYSFHISGEGTVAGQKTKKFIIQPKDQYRYGHALWVDEKTGLLLKDHLLDNDGQTVEQFMFTRINYPSSIKEELMLVNDKRKKYTWFEAKEPATKQAVNNSMNWKVTSVPDGFMPGVKRHHKMTMSAMPVEHFMFSDGLSSVSVFVEKQMKNSKNLMGGSTMGAVNAYGRALDDHHITVVGEVPQITVKMIGDSVQQIKH